MIINKKGVTLIELLVVIAIIGILAGVLVVGANAYRARARSTKALAQLSSAMPSVYSCWGNGYDVPDPDSNGGECICKNGANCVDSYGKWPAVSGDLSNYDYSSNINDNQKTFVVRFTNTGDDQRICCTSVIKECRPLNSAGATCNLNDPAN